MTNFTIYRDFPFKKFSDNNMLDLTHDGKSLSLAKITFRSSVWAIVFASLRLWSLCRRHWSRITDKITGPNNHATDHPMYPTKYTMPD